MWWAEQPFTVTPEYVTRWIERKFFADRPLGQRISTLHRLARLHNHAPSRDGHGIPDRRSACNRLLGIDGRRVCRVELRSAQQPAAARLLRRPALLRRRRSRPAGGSGDLQAHRPIGVEAGARHLVAHQGSLAHLPAGADPRGCGPSTSKPRFSRAIRPRGQLPLDELPGNDSTSLPQSRWKGGRAVECTGLEDQGSMFGPSFAPLGS